VVVGRQGPVREGHARRGIQPDVVGQCASCRNDRLVGPSEWDCFLNVKSVDRIEVTRKPQRATAAAIALARLERQAAVARAVGPCRGGAGDGQRVGWRMAAAWRSVSRPEVTGASLSRSSAVTGLAAWAIRPVSRERATTSSARCLRLAW